MTYESLLSIHANHTSFCMDQVDPIAPLNLSDDGGAAPLFTDAFLDALGRWQRGWRRNPEARKPIAAALESEALELPARFRQPRGPVFRKRHLYRTTDQRELVPLFLSGTLDEASATSWSADRAVVTTLGDDASFGHPHVTAGAIFEHHPSADEMVLDIPALWDDQDFVRAVHDYEARGGAEAAALRNFGKRQAEIILRAPLRLTEIVALSRTGDFESLASAAGAITNDQQSDLSSELHTAGILLDLPHELSRAAVDRVIASVTRQIREKISLRAAMHMPLEPLPTPGQRGQFRYRLIDLVTLAGTVLSPDARLLSWSRLPSRDGIMAARWSDGTVGFKSKAGRIWLAAKT